MDKNVFIRLVRDDGETFLINNTDWMIPSSGLSGFGAVDNSITTQTMMGQDGDVVVAQRLTKVDRTVKCLVANPKLNETLRTKAIRFFNVKHKYKLYISYMGNQRWTDCVLKKVALSEGNIYKRVSLQFTVTCPNPYLKSIDDFGRDIASIMGMVAFPYLCPIDVGTPTSYYRYSDTVSITNDGDVSTYVKVVIRFSAETINPVFYINDKFVRILGTFDSNHEIEIDFTATPPTVRLNGENYIGHCDRASSFTDMQLNVGDNTVKYNADNGNENMSVSIYYNNLYTLI